MMTDNGQRTTCSAADLAGYCMELTAWRMMRDVSSASERTGRICPATILLTDDGGFVLATDDTLPYDVRFVAPEGTADGVWSLAASVFYAVMGCHVMNGQGGRGQHAHSKLPYMRTEMPVLSMLVQQCLQYDPARRPSMEEVNRKAVEEYDALQQRIMRGPSLKEPEAPPPSAVDVPFWPEEMISMKTLLIIVFFFLSVIGVSAQRSSDKELKKLIDAVERLRQTDESRQRAAWKQVEDMLHADELWTPMDELIDDRTGNECRLTDKKVHWFRLNRILQQAPAQANNKKNVTPGNFLNGEDLRYHYSLIEKSIKAGTTVRYRPIKGREGTQYFVVMPFDKKTARLGMKVSRDGEALPLKIKEKDGNLYVELSVEPALAVDDPLVIEVTNEGAADAAFVIINYNTRK